MEAELQSKTICGFAVSLGRFALFSYFVFSVAGCSDSAPSMEIIYPTNGEVLYTNRHTSILVSVDAAAGTSLISASAQHMASGKTISIGEIKIAQPYRDDEVRLLWDPAEFPLGLYSVDVTLTKNGISKNRSTKIQLNGPPEVDVSLADFRSTPTGMEAAFKIKAKSPSNIPIARYRWFIGKDDQYVDTIKPTLRHLFKPGSKTWLAVVVMDNLGGSTLRVFPITIPLVFSGIPDIFFAPQAQVCGCNSMVVSQSPGRSKTYCLSPAVAAIAKGGAYGATAAPPPPGPPAPGGVPPSPCPPGKVGVQFPLGPIQPNAAVNPPITAISPAGFEIEATLAPGSTPNACQEGQFVKEDITVNGKRASINTQLKPATGITLPAANVPTPPPAGAMTVTIVPPGSVIPAVANPSGKWGGDNYTSPGDSPPKVHEPGKIRWWDGPGFHPKKAPSGSALLAFEFVSFVVGGGGTCYCHFRMNRAWKSTRTPAFIGPGTSLIKGVNCRVQ